MKYHIKIVETEKNTVLYDDIITHVVSGIILQPSDDAQAQAQAQSLLIGDRNNKINVANALLCSLRSVRDSEALSKEEIYATILKFLEEYNNVHND